MGKLKSKMLTFETSSYMIEKDPLMYNSNTNIDDFNCGGFALQTLTWYMPKSWRKHRDDDFNSIEEIDCLLETCADEIQEDYIFRYRGIEELARIDDIESAPIGIEVIGFRFAIDEFIGKNDEDTFYEIDDFHFIWRDASGMWWEKMGASEVRELPFDPRDIWNDRYDGRIIWFAKVAL